MATLKRIGALTPDVAKAAAERIKELEKQKAELQHGEWLAMVEKRLPGSRVSGPRAIRAQKQVSYGVSHSQCEQAPPPVLVKVVKHMATLAKGLQISQPVIGGIMVKVRGRQRDLGCANSDVVANSSKAAQSPSASIAPGPFVFIPPSTVA